FGQLAGHASLPILGCAGCESLNESYVISLRGVTISVKAAGFAGLKQKSPEQGAPGFSDFGSGQARIRRSDAGALVGEHLEVVHRPAVVGLDRAGVTGSAVTGELGGRARGDLAGGAEPEGVLIEVGGD